MRILILSLLLFCLTFQANALKIYTRGSNKMVTLARGTELLYFDCIIFPDTFSNADSFELQDFPFLAYNDMDSILIEKAEVLDSVTVSSFIPISRAIFDTFETVLSLSDSEFAQGRTYLYRLSVIDKKHDIYPLSVSSTYSVFAEPHILCMKLNLVHRKACHNCFQENIIPLKIGGFKKAFDNTKVVELDIYKEGTDWRVYHAWGWLPIRDNNCNPTSSGSSPKLGGCLDDIVDWHTRNPDHDVIILHVDLKDIVMSSDQITALNNMLRNKFGTALYTPTDLLGGAPSVQIAAWHNNWPSMKDLTGKVMVVMTGPQISVSNYMIGSSTHGQLGFGATTSVDLTPFGILRDYVVYYNVPISEASTGTFPHAMNWLSRTYSSDFVGKPATLSTSEYLFAWADGLISNIATADVTKHYANEDGLAYPDLPHLYSWNLQYDHIYAGYKNVSRYAYTSLAGSPTVEPNGHYRAVAAKQVELTAGTQLMYGSDVEVKIDNCGGVAGIPENGNNNGGGEAPNISEMLARKGGETTNTSHDYQQLLLRLQSELYQNFESGTTLPPFNAVIFPNPVKSECTLSINGNGLQNCHIIISDAVGRTLKSLNAEMSNRYHNVKAIDLSELRPGTYFYEVICNEQIVRGRIVKID